MKAFVKFYLLGKLNKGFFADGVTHYRLVINNNNSPTPALFSRLFTLIYFYWKIESM